MSVGKEGLYGGAARGNVPHFSPELFLKYDGSRGADYPIDLFKNDVYGNGILTIEQNISFIYSFFNFFNLFSLVSLTNYFSLKQ